MTKKNIPSISNKNEEDNIEKKNSNYIDMLKYYYGPLIVLAIFFVILIFGLIPSINSLYDTYQSRNIVKAEVSSLDVRIADLKRLKNDSPKTNDYLESINSIAPVQRTNVTEFQEKIKNIAKENNLTTESAKTRELIFDENADNTDYLLLIEVPSEFTFSGEFVDVKAFLAELYESDEFIIIEEMRFLKNPKDSMWTLDITLNKYQFSLNEESEEQSNVYLNIPEKAVPNKEVIEFLDENY